jgi:hypothetical protein
MPVNMPKARYFSAFPCTARDNVSAALTCVIFKDHTRERMVALASSSDGLRFGSWQKVVRLRKKVTRSTRDSVMVSPKVIAGGMLHNLALLQESSTNTGVEKWVLVGGTYRYEPRKLRKGDWLVKDHQGIWSVTMDSMMEPSRRSTVTEERLLFDGLHSGCMEARGRDRFPYLVHSVESSSSNRTGCEFDGRYGSSVSMTGASGICACAMPNVKFSPSISRLSRLALVRFDGKYLLYGRANMGSRGGQRFVQMTSSVDMKTWSSFRPISITGYSHSEGDIYFWAVQTNPARPSTLLSVFPLVHRLEGCLGIALSLDGIRWSRVRPLLACASVGERTLSHPAAPSMMRASDDSNSVWIYVHENVTGASLDMYLPLTLREVYTQTEGPSRLVRYTLPMDVLKRWTILATRDLMDS